MGFVPALPFCHAVTCPVHMHLFCFCFCFWLKELSAERVHSPSWTAGGSLPLFLRPSPAAISVWPLEGARRTWMVLLGTRRKSGVPCVPPQGARWHVGRRYGNNILCTWSSDPSGARGYTRANLKCVSEFPQVHLRPGG